MNIREKELIYLKKGKYLDAICVYFWGTTTIIVTTLTFEYYTYLGFELTSKNVFTTIALYNILVFPLNALPWNIGGMKTAYVSILRI